MGKGITNKIPLLNLQFVVRNQNEIAKFKRLKNNIKKNLIMINKTSRSL